MQRRGARRFRDAFAQHGLDFRLRAARTIDVGEIHPRFDRRGIDLERLAGFGNRAFEVAARGVETGEAHPSFRPVGVVGLHRDVFGERLGEGVAVGCRKARLRRSRQSSGRLDPDAAHGVVQHPRQITHARGGIGGADRLDGGEPHDRIGIVERLDDRWQRRR